MDFVDDQSAPNVTFMKCLFTIFFCLVSHLFYAQQIDQGWILGGAIGFDRSTNTTLFLGSFDHESSQNSFRFRPYLGKSVSEKWIVGVTSNYLLQIEHLDLMEDNRNQETIGNAMSLGVFGRYRLFVTEDRKLKIHLEPVLGTNIGWTNVRERDVEISTIRSHSMQVEANPLVTFRIGEQVNLTARFSGLSYEVGKWTIPGNPSKKAFSQFKTLLDATHMQLGVEFKL